MGYTQEQFSEVTGVPLSTLKKYLADKCPYTIDLLELFAEKLECSYDYLMGYSMTPDRDLQSVKDATRLPDVAVNKLQLIAKLYDTEKTSRGFIDMLGEMIERDGFIETISGYVHPKEDTMMLYDTIKVKSGIQASYETLASVAVLNELNSLRVNK